MSIQLACSRRPRALEEAHCWNIQAKFYNEKFPLVIWKWQNKRLSIMKIMVLLWSTSVAKYSSIVPSLFFSHFLAFSFCSWPFSFFGGNNALLNDDHHTSIYLQLNDYNSILEHSMTLYECLRRCTGICNESWVTCMKELWTVALPQILCQLHDHASNMAMMNVSW